MTEVNGKAAACVSGVLSVKRKAFVLEAPGSSDADVSAAVGGAKAATPASSKRKPSDATVSLLPIVEYREKSAMLLGQVDEDKLERQVKAVRACLCERRRGCYLYYCTWTVRTVLT